MMIECVCLSITNNFVERYEIRLKGRERQGKMKEMLRNGTFVFA
jgi:hypothetical protein